MPELIDRLGEIVGPAGLLRGAELAGRSAGYKRPLEELTAKALVRPASTEEVARVLELCNEAGQSVVTQGGLTGLVDGNLSTAGDIILSLERMRTIEEIDPASATMTVQAGVTLQAVQEAAAEAGFLFPLDLGGRGSATIGGNIATNAGGNRVLRYGMARDMVLGLEVVQADGVVLSSLGKIIKNNAGYDLKQMFIGSEGTLGVVTRIVLRLRPMPASQQTAYLAVGQFDDLPKLLDFCNRRSGGAVTAFEVMWRDFYELVTSAPGANPPLPLDYPFYILMEAMGGDPEADQERFEMMLAAALDDGLLLDAVIAKSQTETNAMWALRDDVESLRTFGPTVGFDVGLPIALMPDYIDEVDKPILARWPDRRRFVFGHLGDGNLHLTYSVGDASAETRKLIDDAVYYPLASRGGSVSAEHGIGLSKRPYLEVSRSEAELALMRRIKAMMDPNGILNPGKVI
ncbi:MAG: FAD-binding oxidoreductase [Alphaproteobacteria bacterium]|jgi:FAD/FMN-containing dehydrogenase|nr:FAD-binding oxidoreductase [Alphaproteobacteria bacterium]MDP6812845.1 FAD-binding oxidoreductase [Alphaproteobacteria bacterium]